MKTFKHEINGKREHLPDNSLLNPKKIKARKEKIKELEDEEAEKEIKQAIQGG